MRNLPILKLFSATKNRNVTIEVERKRPLPSGMPNAPVIQKEGVSVYNVPFVSPEHVKVTKADPYMYNTRFPVRMYVPEAKRTNRIFIMINGFAEGRPEFWDHLGIALAKAGSAAALMPLPQHFCRHALLNINEYNATDPYLINDEYLDIYTKSLKYGLTSRPDSAIHFNRQVLKDIEFLARGLRGEQSFSDEGMNTFATQFLEDDTTVSIIGFSLGGLVALQSFLTHSSLLNACFLVNSGASFQDMNASEVFKEEWETLQMNILRKAKHHRNEIAPNFERIFLGHEKVATRHDIKVNCDRILFIMGGSDPVMNVRNIMNLDASGVGLALFQVPRMPHFINVNSRGADRWREYSSLVLGLVAQFDDFARERPRFD